jgi:hypothetical protein
VTPGCPCTSTFNGEPGHPCCRTCRDGTPCVANFHTRPFPEADRHSTLPQGQADAAATGPLMPQQTAIDLSHDADVDADDGDMYTTCWPCTHHHTHHTTLWSIDQSHPRWSQMTGRLSAASLWLPSLST